MSGRKAEERHGMCGTRLYNVWKCMKSRCSNPNSEKWDRYGGRGIAVCTEWGEFAPFYEWAITNGYREGLTIDRIDNDGNYEPSNCRWADYGTQAINRSQHPSNTGHLGIHKRTRRGKRGETTRYVARVKRNQKMHVVGSFKTLEEAIKARACFIESLGEQV